MDRTSAKWRVKPWSHLDGKNDALVTVKPLRDGFDAGALAALLKPGAQDEAAFAVLRGAETTGRPLGNEGFIKGLKCEFRGTRDYLQPEIRRTSNRRSLATSK